MIKKIIALVSCLSIVFAFSACGDDDKETTTGDSASTVEEQTTEVTTEEQTDASYEVDTTEPQERDITISNGALESNYYTMDVGDDWDLTSGSDMLALIKKKGENSSESSPDISIVYSEQYEGKSSKMVLKELKSQYEALEGYKIESTEITEIGEYDAVIIDSSFDFSNTQTKTKQVCIIGENGGVTITYTALADIYDETVSEIDDMISTIKLK